MSIRSGRPAALQSARTSRAGLSTVVYCRSAWTSVLFEDPPAWADRAGKTARRNHERPLIRLQCYEARRDRRS